jgi:hypothetical protein
MPWRGGFMTYLSMSKFTHKLTLYVPTIDKDGKMFRVNGLTPERHWLTEMQRTFGGVSAVRAFGIDNKGQEEQVYLVSSLFETNEKNLLAVCEITDCFTNWCADEEAGNQTSSLFELSKVEAILSC